MSADEVKEQLEFERSLKVGDRCKAYWTNCGSYYGTEVEVVAINQKSFRVRITKPATDYPAGQNLNIPNFLNVDRWTWNNRLAPITEKGG